MHARLGGKHVAGLFDLEHYAEAEVRMAKPEEYSLKDSLARVKDVFNKYFTDFRNQVSQEQQFKAFQEIIERQIKVSVQR